MGLEPVLSVEFCCRSDFIRTGLQGKIMKDLTIDRAEVFVVGPETERYVWAEGMSEQFMANIILKLTSKGGLEGIAGAAMINAHSFDRAVGETLRFLLPDVIGANPLEREALWYRMRNLGTP